MIIAPPMVATPRIGKRFSKNDIFIKVIGHKHHRRPVHHTLLTMEKVQSPNNAFIKETTRKQPLQDARLRVFNPELGPPRMKPAIFAAPTA